MVLFVVVQWRPTEGCRLRLLCCLAVALLCSHPLLTFPVISSPSCQVLVSTATLAWGVNLPAHTVIIKGTQVTHN